MLAQVKERGYKVTYDGEDGNCFKVVKPDGSVRVLSQSERGLYFIETNPYGNEVALVNTVEDSRNYSRGEYARKLQGIIGHPITCQNTSIVERNLLPNCPISRHDIAAAEEIFGPDTGSLEGKTVRRPPHVAIKLVDVPLKLMQQYCNVALAGDIMFVNHIPICDGVTCR